MISSHQRIKMIKKNIYLATKLKWCIRCCRMKNFFFGLHFIPVRHSLFLRQITLKRKKMKRKKKWKMKWFFVGRDKNYFKRKYLLILLSEKNLRHFFRLSTRQFDVIRVLLSVSRNYAADEQREKTFSFCLFTFLIRRISFCDVLFRFARNNNPLTTQ